MVKYKYVAKDDVTKKDIVDFINEKILSPVLNDPKSSKESKRAASFSRRCLSSKTYNANSCIKYFLNAIESKNGQETYKQLKNDGCVSFEKYKDEFIKRFIKTE